MRILRRVNAFLKDELRAASSLISLLFVSLFIVFILARSGVSLAYPSFQSPESPIATPTSPPPAPETPTVPSPELPTPTGPPSETPPVSPVTPTVTMEMETPSAEPQITPTEGAAPEEPAPEEEPPSAQGGAGAVFIDTCVVGFSYIWLICGAMVLLLFVLGVVLSFLVRRA